MTENFDKRRPTDRPIDKAAALELAQTNSVLRDDVYTMQAIRDGGYMYKGKFTPITHFDDFLSDREKSLKNDQRPFGKGGPVVKPDHMVQHSDPKEKAE